MTLRSCTAQCRPAGDRRRHGRADSPVSLETVEIAIDAIPGAREAVAGAFEDQTNAGEGDGEDGREA
jgi:hypothetical protein